LGASAAQAQDRVVLGAGVAATPVYQGSSDYRVLPIPVIDIKKNGFFANLRNGVGVEPIDNETLTVGASAVFVQGYRKRDVPQGVDKLSNGAGVRLFTTVRMSGFVATVGGVKVVSGGSKGFVADGSVSYPIRLSPKLALTPTLGATWADSQYNDRYFGLNAREAALSGLPQFTAGAGFKDLSGTLTASYRVTDQISLSATGGVTRLLGEVKGSALVEKTQQPFGILSLTYRLRD
jgi:outer membrane protein